MNYNRKNIEKKIALDLDLARFFPKIVAIIIVVLSVKKFQHHTSCTEARTVTYGQLKMTIQKTLGRG